MVTWWGVEAIVFFRLNLNGNEACISELHITDSERHTCKQYPLNRNKKWLNVSLNLYNYSYYMPKRNRIYLLHISIFSLLFGLVHI